MGRSHTKKLDSGPARRLLSAAFACLMCVGVPARAETLLEIYTEATSNDAEVAAARANFRVIEKDVHIARSAMLPNAGASAFTEKIARDFPGVNIFDANPNSPTFGTFQAIPTQEFNQHGYNAQVTQPILAAETWFTFRSAQEARSQGRYNLGAVEQNLIVRVADAYLNVLRAQDSLESALAQETAFARQLDQVQQRFDVGLVAVTDVLDAQAAYDQAQVVRIQAAGNLDIVFQNLSVLTGVPYSQVARFNARLPITYPEPQNPDYWADIAVDGNFQVLAASKAVDAAQKQLRARKAAHAPTVNAQVGFNHFTTGGPAFLGSSIDETNFRLSVNVPLYQGGRLFHQGRQAKARLDQAQQNLVLQRRTVIRDARSLFRAASNGVDRVRARARAVRSAESALEATRTGYEVGTRNIVDVLQAEQRFVQSQFDFADSRYTYVLDSLRLLQAAGTLAAPDLQEVNDFIDPEDTVERVATANNFKPAGDSE